MGVSHLATAKPKRLYRDGDQWVLEIERLMPWSDRILRPTTQRLVGEDVVLFQLDNSEDGRALSSDARRLMADGEARQSSYAVMDGWWVPTAFADQVAPIATPRERPAIVQKAPALSAGSLEVHLLREDLRELKAAYDRLARRVTTLEKNPRAASDAHDGPAHEAPAPPPPPHRRTLGW